MVPEILARVCGHKGKWTVRPAILHDYRRHRVAGADYPAIIPTPKASVRGTYVTGLSNSDITKLDIFEGSEYKRADVKVNVLDVVGDADGEGNVEGEEFEVQTYVWISRKSYLEDKEWDFAEFQKEKMRRWIGSHEEYEGETSRERRSWFRCPRLTILQKLTRRSGKGK